jgi:hypothetical protein
MFPRNVIYSFNFCHPQEFLLTDSSLQKSVTTSWALVAHTCNPSYTGDRDQEDDGSKPAQAKQFTRPSLRKKPITKKGLVEWLKVKALCSNPSITEKKERKNY